MMVPNVVVLSKGKQDFTFTADWFRKHRFSNATWILSRGDDIGAYHEMCGCRVMFAKTVDHLSSKRQWVVDNFTSDSKPWVMIFEDNIIRVTGVILSEFETEKFDKTTRSLFHSTEYSPQEVLRIVSKDIDICERLNISYGGFACNDNHFFRKTKYREVAFVWTKMCFISRNGPKQAIYLPDKCDYGYTAECLKQDGGTLVNNFLYPWTKKFEGRRGSLTKEQRMEPKRRAVKILMQKFPGLFRVKRRSGFEDGTEIQLRFTNRKQVQKWREHNEYS